MYIYDNFKIQLSLFKMFSLILPLLVITPMLVSSETPTRRTLGDMKVPNRIQSIPYQVSIRDIRKGHFCGGSIITPGAILTAAHCIKGKKPELLEVVVGTNNVRVGGQAYSIKKIVSHEKYENDSNQNDIAILFTDKDIQFSDNIDAVKLNDEPVELGEQLLVTGWGYTANNMFCNDEPPKATDRPTEATPSIAKKKKCDYRGPVPSNLMQLNVEAVPYKECKTALEDLIPVHETQICAVAGAGKGVCYGDSGGPLVKVKEGTQVGIASEISPPCGSGKPDIYTNVRSFIPWIKKTLLTNNPSYDDNDYEEDDSDEYSDEEEGL